MAMVEDISSGMDVETIIISKNITDPITIEFLRKINESKKSKTQSSTMMCAQPTVMTSLKQPSPSSHEEVIKVASPTSTLDVIKEPMAPSPIEPMVSSSTSTTLEVQSPPKVNYFTNLPSDRDEFNPYNSIDNSLPHSRIIAYFDSSINILKTKILELEKMKVFTNLTWVNLKE
jgi:hypothetical protein